LIWRAILAFIDEGVSIQHAVWIYRLAVQQMLCCESILSDRCLGSVLHVRSKCLEC